MAGIKETHLRVRYVALECLCSSGQEERIVLSPYGKERGLVAAEILLKRGIQRDVASVVAEQIELDLVIAGSGEERRE